MLTRKEAAAVERQRREYGDRHSGFPNCDAGQPVTETSSPISAASIRLSEQELQAEQIRQMIDSELIKGNPDILKVEKLEFALDLIESQRIGSRIFRI